MKTKSIQSYIIAISMLATFSTKAQISYEIFTDIGYNNFIEEDKDSTIDVGNTYTGLPFFSVGTEALLTIKEQFYISSGLSYALISAKNKTPHTSSHNTGTASQWKERLHTLSVPLKLGLKPEDWMRIYAGVSNTFYLNTPKEMFDKKVNTYALSFIGGVDFIIKERFTLGASYTRNITPMSELLQLPSTSQTYDIKYYTSQIGIKLGYIFGK